MSPDLVWNKNCIMSVDTVLRARSLRLSHVLWLLENLMRFGFLGISQNEVHASRYKQVSKITEMIAFGAERLISTALMSGANNPKRTYEIPSVVRHMIFETPDYENDLVPFQSLVLYLLHVLFRNQYARYKGGIYEEIKHEGVPTRAWSRKYDMVTFIHDNTKKEVSFRQWKNMTMIYGRMRDIVKYLNNCQELEFPELKPDRHVFSFRNCVYFAKEDRTEAHENVPRHVVACKYFDMDFDETPCPPMDVPTPHFDKFFEAQKIGPDVMFWIYALMGRKPVRHRRDGRVGGLPVFSRASRGAASRPSSRSFGMFTIWKTRRSSPPPRRRSSGWGRCTTSTCGCAPRSRPPCPRTSTARTSRT